MFRRATIGLPFALAAIAVPTLALAQSAGDESGGASFDAPVVTGFDCPAGAEGACPRQATLRVDGEHLEDTESVVFTGGDGEADDRRATPSAAGTSRVVVTVPAGARTGPVEVVTADGSVLGPRLRVLPAESEEDADPAPRRAVFPIRGRHRFGTGAAAFGGGRGHQGQDVFADCGTPLAAALGGKVSYTAFQSAAGNYVVIAQADGTSQAYMHLLRPTTVEVGDRIAAGDRIGQVGQTGRADGCHLHFEWWTSPGWQAGGEPVDPLPRLRAWDRAD